MRRAISFWIFLAFITTGAFAQNGEFDQSDDKLIQVRLGAGLLYMHGLDGVPEYGVFSLSNLRCGICGDVLFSFGLVEAGVEAGIHIGILEDGMLPVFEIPLDLLLRINFDDDRSVALEVTGGFWYKAIPADDKTGGIYTNGGVRFVACGFYGGIDFVFSLMPEYSIWAAFNLGYKFTFW